MTRESALVDRIIRWLMSYERYCRETHDKWICTEPPGHDGPHRAAGGWDIVYHQWARPEDPADCPEPGCILAAGHSPRHAGVWSKPSGCGT